MPIDTDSQDRAAEQDHMERFRRAELEVIQAFKETQQFRDAVSLAMDGQSSMAKEIKKVIESDT